MSEEKDDILTAVRARLTEPVQPSPITEAGLVSRSTSKAISTSPTITKAPVHNLTEGSSKAPEKSSDDAPPPLYVGIDLGTSRSAICASNGRRATLPTVVGWPKDPIARQFLGKDIVFGEEAVKNRMSSDICSPVQRGVIQIGDEDEVSSGLSTNGGNKSKKLSRAQEAASELLNYLIFMIQPLPNQKVYATIGTPGNISSVHKQALIDAAKSNVEQVHLTTEPFAVAYSLENLHHVLIVDIGAGTTDLCRVHGSIPESYDYVTLNEAGDHIDKTLFNLLRSKHDKAQFSIGQVKECKERSATVLKSGEAINALFPINGIPTNLEITEDLKKSCLSIVDPIVKAIFQLVGTYDPEFQSDLKSQIWLAGGGSMITGLSQVVEDKLSALGAGVKVQRVEDPVYAGASGALMLAQTIPSDYWEVLA